MKIRILFGIVGFLFGFFVLFPVLKGQTHSWYDIDCCHDKDCAPVTSITKGPDKDTDLMMTIHGTYAIKRDGDFNRRPSKDGNFHVCANQFRIICVYYPPLY